MLRTCAILLVLAPLLAILAIPAGAAEILPGFRSGPWWDEQVREEISPEGIRLAFNAPASVDPEKPTLIVFYATPNGNTIEQTLGCAKATGLDWHYDIQHIAAQARRLRALDTRENIVLVVAEAEGKSWPAWRQKHADNAAQIRRAVEAAMQRVPGNPRRVALSGHSGGGSFLFGFLNSADTVPDWVERIAFLDANYSYSSEDGHGTKLLAWLKGDAKRRLVVLAYDDRAIMLDGKPVVGPTGGTWRASFRMIEDFRKEFPLTETHAGDLDTFTGRDGQASFTLDRNPENKILHTVLVETNGFLQAMTLGTPEEGKWGAYRGPRAYSDWIQPATVTAPVGTARAARIPPRPADAEGGAAFMRRIASLPKDQREAAILAEITRGNVPDFLRTFKTLEVKSIDATGRSHTARIHVMPDYLAVGSDTDFARVPMTPMTAQNIADAFGCSLMTRRLSDAVWQNAEVKMEPRPLTERREDVDTFLQHNGIIEGQRAGSAPGLLVAGIKKDVVLTNLLSERPHRVAIYGWHYLTGVPIQPLTTVHVDTYVDYSHGIRLVLREMIVDGRRRDIRDVLADPDLCALVSDEGPITSVAYGTGG